MQCSGLPPPPVDGNALVVNSGSRYGKVCAGSTGSPVVVSPAACPDVAVQAIGKNSGVVTFRLTISATGNPAYWNALVVKFSSIPTNVNVRDKS